MHRRSWSGMTPVAYMPMRRLQSLLLHRKAAHRFAIEGGLRPCRCKSDTARVPPGEGHQPLAFYAGTTVDSSLFLFLIARCQVLAIFACGNEGATAGKS